MAPMLEDVLQRRPYNAVSDFVDANVARGLGGKVAFTDSERSLTYGALQERSCRFATALKALGLREENRVVLLFHDTVDYPGRLLGRDPRRRGPDSDQYAAHRRAICLPVCGQPRRGGRGRCPARADAAVDPRPAAASAHDHRRRGGRRGQSGLARRALFRGRARARQAGAVRRADHVRRGGTLDVYVGLDRRSQGGAARPHQPDGASPG